MKILYLSLLVSIFLVACTSNSSVPKYNNALVPSSELPSSIYPINADSGALLQDPSGKLLYIPENAFVDENGKEVHGAIDVEFTVLSGMSDILLAGMSSKTADGASLSQEAVFFIDASARGKKLKVKEGSALSYFAEDGNALYSGEYNKDKKLEWTKKIEPEKFLITVPLSELDFCPEGVAPIISRYLPFKGNTVLTDQLRDSVYYSLSARFYVSKGESESYLDDFFHVADSMLPLCGIDPAAIKAIKSPKFENTLIATKEFETRLQRIHKTGQRSLLDVYINNLDLPLWKLDSMAASVCAGDNKKIFEDYAAQKLGRVEKRVSSEKMKAFFAREKARLKKEVEELEKKYQKEHQKDKKELVQLKTKYSQMLVKRQEYRLEKVGWYDEGRVFVPVGEFKFEISGRVEPGFDRMYSYLILPEIKSIMAVNVDPQDGAISFFPEDNFLIYKEGMKIWGIAVCFKGDNVYFAKQEIIGSGNLIINLSPVQITKQQLKENLNYESSYKDFNKIEEDIAIREKMFEKEKKIKEHERLEMMIRELVESIQACPGEAKDTTAK